MPRYIKSHSNYVLRKQHQFVKNGTIFERDWVTVGGTGRFTPGQTPVYANGNFIFTINNTPFSQKKHKYGHWVTSPDGDSTWTDDEVENINLSDTDSDIEINEVSNDLRDFAYFGSCSELIRASIEDIIKNFPAELYFSGKITQIATGNTESQNPFQTVEGFIVDNNFNINLIDNNVILNEYENDLRYFSYSFKDYEIISGNTIIPVTSVTIINENVDVNCLTEGQLLNTITINGNIIIKGRFVNGERQFFHNTTIGLHVRPNKKRIDKYFNNLDGFEKILLNRKSKPIYTNIFLTPIETNKGITFVNRKYSWAVVNGWNLDISSPNYLSFVNSLSSIAEILDEYYCDNIYRSMTHEAIKNFDWTYTREYNDGDEQEFVIAGNKIVNILRLYGRILDDIKRYIDGIKFTNTLTYNRQNNISDYFLSDKLELSGWEASTVVKSGTENDTTDILYSGESTGYTFNEVNNQFMRRLVLCSKAIFKAKGTRKAIEMLMGMFGVDKDWYSINEYHYTCTPITNQNTISLIQTINSDKNVVLLDEDNPYSGLLVKEINDGNNTFLVPWFDKNEIYDGNPYFQSNGGWGSEKPLPLNNDNFIYKETMPYINMVSTIDELFTLSIGRMSSNDVYYVYDISDISDYNFTYDNPSLSGNPTNYFILGNGNNSIDEDIIINNSRNASGWTCVTYNVVGIDKIISNERVVYLESIISKNYGNNPHIGYGHYDMGKEFFDYIKELFKYSLDNSQIYGTDDELNTYKTIGFTDLDFNNPVLDPIKIQNIDVYKNICGKNNTKIVKVNESKVFLNTKLIVIENKYGGNKDFREYFTNHILPYVEQIIPSTAIFGIKGFDEYGGKYLTLSTNEVKLNDSMNSVTHKDVTLNASSSWKSSPSSTLTNGTPSSSSENNLTFTVEKKKDEKKYGSEKIIFSLNEDNSINSILNVTVSQISASDILFNKASGGTKTTNVMVDGLSNNPNYYLNNNVSWANVVKNGNVITVVATQNNSSNQRNGTITVYNSNDSNCYWVINVSQVGADISIESSCLYQSKNGIIPNCTNEVPYIGGVYYIDVKAIGGAQDFSFLLTDGDNNLITCNKLGSDLLKVTIAENTKTEDINFAITFTHLSDDNAKSTTLFKLLKASGLSITVNGQNEATGEVQYIGGNITPNFIVNAIGASKTWNIDTSTVPNWLTINKDVNNLIFTADSTTNTLSRDARIVVYHNDDISVKAYIIVTQKGVGELSIVATPDIIIFDSNGGSVIINVDVYGGLKDYTITSSCNWVSTENNILGDYGNYKEYKLVVNASQYKDTSSDRMCVLSLIHKDNSTIIENIKITQTSAIAYDIYATKIGETIPVTSVVDIPFTQSTEESGLRFDVHTSPSYADYITNSSVSWIYTSTNGKTLTVWFDTNSSQTERSGEIILKNSLDTTKTHTIIFTQQGAGLLYIGGKLPSDTEYNSNVSLQFEATDGNKQVDIKVSGGLAEFILDSVNAAKYKWIHISPTSGKTGQVTIKCDANTENNNRNGTIVLVHSDNTDYSLIINVEQKQGYQLTIEPNDGGSSINQSTLLDVAQSGIIKTFNIAALGGDAKYKYSGSNIDWILGNDKPLTNLLSGTSDTIFKLQVLPNETGVVRSATVIFEHVNDSSKKVSIIINQLVVVYDILIDNEKEIQWNEIESTEIEKMFNITISGGSMQYIVDDPIECTYNEETGLYTEGSEKVEWVNPFKQGNSLLVNLNENGLPTIRAAKIKVKHSDKPNDVYAELYLWQKAAVIEYKNYQITTIPTGSTFSNEGGAIFVKVSSTRDKFVNGNFIKKEDVPYKIKIEDDIPVTYTNIFKVYGKETDQTYNVDASGTTVDMAVTSVLKNDVTSSENFIVWTATSDSDWVKIDFIDDNRITVSITENITNTNRSGKITFKQDKEDPKTIVITYSQEHYPQNVVWSDPAENTTKEITSDGTTFIAYADTTALTYNDVIVKKDPNDTWVTISNPLQGDNEYGQKAVKVEIIVSENNDNDRELSVIIDKK